MEGPADWFGCFDDPDFVLGGLVVAVLLFSAGWGAAKADTLVRNIAARLRARKENKP